MMTTWNDYKKHIHEVDTEMAVSLDETAARARIISAIIDQRHNLGLSQRDLAEMCGLPHSSIAGIESGKSIPNLNTLLKIFNKLGLTFLIQPSHSVKAAR